jgi:transcriptional regulator with XRE-family HTH domain
MKLKLASEITLEPLLNYGQALEFIGNPRFLKRRPLTKDIKSAVNQWLKFNNLNLESIVGDEFKENFQANLALLEKQYANKDSWYAIKSKIDLCNQAFQQLSPSKAVTDDSFKTFIVNELKIRSWSRRELCRRAKVSNVLLSRWLTGERVPSSQKSRPHLRALSQALGFPKEYIETNYVLTLKHQTRKKQEIGITSAGLKVQKSKEKQNLYGLTKKEWDHELSLKELKKSLDPKDPFYEVKKEFANYYHYKTTLNLRDDLEIEDTWKVDGNGKCTSAIIITGKLKSYYGFLKNIEKRQHFTIMDLFDLNLLANYYEYWIEKYGGPTKTIVVFSSSVISPMLTYYRNYPELLKTLGNKETFKLKEKYDRYRPDCSWEDFLIENIQEVISEIIRKARSQSLKMSNKGIPAKLVDEKIEDWLALDNPIEPIVPAIEDMKHDYRTLKMSRSTGTNKKERLALLRDIVILDILLEKPIRSETMIQLRLGKEIKHKNNLWHLDIPGKIVKNGKHIKYECSEELSEWITEFARIHKEINSGDFLCKTRQDEICCSLFDIVSKRLEKYTGRAIGSHAFRKLRATHYIINFQDGYLYAAEILDDDIDTVLKEYAYLKNRRLGAMDRANIELMRNKFRENHKNITRVLVNDQPITISPWKEKIVSLVVEQPTDYKDQIFQILNAI